VIEEGTYRFHDDTLVDFDHDGYHGMSPTSDVDTTRTASFSGMSTYQNRVGLSYQEGASVNKVIDSDTGGSLAIRQSLECNGKIGFCGLQHHWVVRPFEKNELLMADFLSQVLSSQPLGWHIYWITSTSFTPNWWPRIGRLSNIVHSEQQQLCRFFFCFGRTILTYISMVLVPLQGMRLKLQRAAINLSRKMRCCILSKIQLNGI
jgi:hypothetical protein